MADGRGRQDANIRYTGSREGEISAYSQQQDSGLYSTAKLVAGVIGATLLGGHLFKKALVHRALAEAYDVAGATAKKAGGFFKKTGPGTLNPMTAERAAKALDVGMPEQAAMLRMKSGVPLSDIASVQDIVEGIGVLADPRYARSRDALESAIRSGLRNLPTTLDQPAVSGSRIIPDGDLLTFGDLLKHNQDFFEHVGRNQFARSGSSLELTAVKHAIRKGWISQNTIVDPKLFKVKNKLGTQSLVDLRITGGKYLTDRVAEVFNPFGIVSSISGLFKSQRKVAILGLDNFKEGTSATIFAGGNVFRTLDNRLSLVAKNQSLGKQGDILFRSSTLRRMRRTGRIKDAYKKLPKGASLYQEMQHKLGIGPEFREHAGGLFRSISKIIKGARAYGEGKAEFVGREYKKVNSTFYHSIAGDETSAILLENATSKNAIVKGRYSGQRGLKNLSFFDRIKGYLGAHEDIVFVKKGKGAGQITNKDLFFPEQGAGLVELAQSIGHSPGKVKGLTAGGSATSQIRAEFYARHDSKLDTLHDFANYLVNRLNTLSSSSLLGIGARPTGSLLRDSAKAAAIPAAYMVGYEALKYADYELGELTGIRPSEKIADIYTGARVAQQRARELTGIRKATEYGETLFPGIDAGVAGTGAALFYGLKSLEKTGSFRAAGKIAGAIYALFGGPDSTQTSEELKREYSGDKKVAIRKSRWWGLGYLPFKGAEISHFEKSWYQKLKHKPELQNIYGSEKNYWKHGSILPNPRNLFGLRKIADPYWVERENYEKRPYRSTGGLGEEIPIIGPLFADTIGAIIKPSVKMHEGEGQRAVAANLANRGAPKDIASQLGIPKAPLALIESTDPNIALNRLEKYANVALEPTGIWKFALGIFGVKFDEGYREATSANINSIAKSFYGANIGGAIGETEYIRRFILSDYGTPSKINAQINNIPNTMPRWLPGRYSNTLADRQSFYDFTSGDAYTKIEGGEYRLPGEGYEALNKLHGAETRRKEQEINYQARVVRVLDGDTVDVKIGDGVQRIRFAETFAPEKNTQAGKDAQAALRSVLKPGDSVIVKTSKDVFGSGEDSGPYGRTVGTIYKKGVNLNKAMVNAGHASHIDSKYDAVDRLLILADVAPNSMAYGAAKREVSRMHLSEEWQQKVDEANEEVIRKKDRYFFRENKEEDLEAAANLSPLSRKVRDTYLSAHENVLSEIPLLGSKIFPKRDPVGHYKKFQLEGDDFADWESPYETIVRPALFDLAGSDPLSGTIKGAAMGLFAISSMSRGFNPFSPLVQNVASTKIIGGAAAIGATLSTGRMAITGKLEGGLTPAHVEDERELKEYFDKIKYVKYRNLMEMGLETRNENLARYAERQAKRTITFGLHDLKVSKDPMLYKMALGRKERDYFNAFVESSDRRGEIFDIVPEHMKQALQGMWGEGGGNLSPDQEVEQYFSEHDLPDSNWLGWHPDVSDSAAQIKMIQGGINGISDSIHRFGFYRSQQREVQTAWGYINQPNDTIFNGSLKTELPWKIKQRGGNVISEFNFGTGPNLNVTNMTLEDSQFDSVFYFMNYIK